MAHDTVREFDSSDSSVAGSIGPYPIVRMLGRGGMGKVYKAWDPWLKQFIAIKVPRDPGELAEAALLAKLAHPNIVRVMSAGEADGVKYLAMEYVHGLELGELCTPAGTLELPLALQILSDVARGLEHAHQKLIVHRDTKPSNIMLDRDGFARVLDLGLGRRLDPSTQSSYHHLVGTWGYIAPELIDLHKPELPSDIFSFGVVAYFVLARELPFGDGHQGADEYIRRVRGEDPKPIESLRPAISAFLARLVHRMLAKDPAARPTISEVAAELDEELARRDIRNGRALLQDYARATVPEDTDQPPRHRPHRPPPRPPGFSTDDTVVVRRPSDAGKVVALSVAIALVLFAAIGAVWKFTSSPPDPPPQKLSAGASIGFDIRPAGSVVSVDGGAPLAGAKLDGLEPGRHHVRATRNGYQTLDTTIQLVAGTTTPFVARLLPRAAPVGDCDQAMQRAEAMPDGIAKGREFERIADACADLKERALYRAAYTYDELGDPASQARVRKLVNYLRSHFQADDDVVHAANLLKYAPTER